LRHDRNGSLNIGKSTWLRDNQLLNLEEIKEQEKEDSLCITVSN
jgi:hypothetical protein